VRGVLDATNSSDRTDDDRERWQRFQGHVCCLCVVCVFRVCCSKQVLKKKEEKEKERRRTFVLLSDE